MIIPNGKVIAIHRSASGIDPTTGYALAASLEREDPPRPCQILRTARNLQARHAGEAVTTISLEILLDDAPLPTEALRLVDDEGDGSGEYAVKSQERWQAVGQWRIKIEAYGHS